MKTANRIESPGGHLSSLRAALPQLARLDSRVDLDGERQTVAVLGGGVAGLSAAHELSERGFEVVVYEARDEPGGKARSMAYEGSGRNGRRDLPGEHGFRFFPGFYRHLPDTMRRIPHGDHPNGVFDNLVAATRILMAQADATSSSPSRICPNRSRTSGS